MKNYIDIIKQTAKTGEYNTIWSRKNCTYSIIVDNYGLGITDGYTVDRPIIYDDKRVAYDFPERLPKYIKEKFSSLAWNGKICNMRDCI